MNSLNLTNFHERELHPFLNYYLYHELEIAAKTIYQERSINTTKGENEWIHPDMVGYSITTSNWSEKVVSLAEHYNISKVVLYSFELKKEITMSNLREVFFQAVSNSSWANEGYLVAAQINTDDIKLMQKMARLSNSFGIGIIQLNLVDPSASKILLSAKRTDEIDGDTVNNLFEINKDFKDFLSDVESGVKINRVVHYHLDEVKTLNELKGVLASLEENEVTPDIPVQDTTHLNDTTEVLSWNDNVTGKKPMSIVIEEKVYEATSWKQIYIIFCKYLCIVNLERFKNTKLKGKKRAYFSSKDNELRVAYYLEEAELYMEVNLSAQSIIKNIRALMVEFNMGSDSVRIVLEHSSN
ncbi:hypothetical protein [Bacillus sp. FJAT-45350]|uniref:hypothetical protein n=1 Tax=Bacillus sp. FJAT-45350 TaxID=2011014 RepID=UPI000BB6D611|nr:hypothetical protein [Bacillus sp. FJAT-45350]